MYRKNLFRRLIFDFDIRNLGIQLPHSRYLLLQSKDDFASRVNEFQKLKIEVPK